MINLAGKNPRDVFPFLDERSAIEPFLFETLLEIDQIQRAFIAGKSSTLATKEHIKLSRNIKIPFTIARDKNIDYILEMLLHRFPMNIGRVISFDFKFDDAQKKLLIKETEEYSVNLPRERFDKLCMQRNQSSLDSLNTLIARFRMFNLSKLVTQSINKQELGKIINASLDKTIFTFKNFSIVRNQVQATEEFCFHSSNYEHIKRTLDIRKIIPVIGVRIDVIKQKLKNFGISSTDVSDYRDTKIDYILNILMEGIASTLAPKEMCEVRNFHSLRECIMKVDKLLDPARIYSGDIVKIIRENGAIPAHDIFSTFPNITADVLSSWASKENLNKESIFLFSDSAGAEWLFDLRNFVKLFESSFDYMRNDPVRFASLPDFEKDMVMKKLSAFYGASGVILTDKNAPAQIRSNPDEMTHLKYVAEEYENYMKQKELRSEVSQASIQGKKGLFSTLIGIVKSIFSIFSGSKSSAQQEASVSKNIQSQNRPLSKETKILYRKASAAKGPILALSDFIELTKENDITVDNIINDMRKNNLKIVMPVYNARTSLYPKRSAKVLMPDIEYLLIPVEAIKSPESITDYVDSLVGFKMKDDSIGGGMLIQIEKYLRTIQRQRKHMKKEAARTS
ncbi:MAG TPA: hypothetical protein PLE16_06775 [Spirochaetota bacterium]|nr:hypothetical protein [Spirochaetota bacterium]HOH37280.1 hypothetical protein [Spirochaetota bacterium]HPM34284.1 hypothetical protein [Spirochaetota bacterium]HPY03204.1 hypothetical protein [Spirochaetota bacterium]